MPVHQARLVGAGTGALTEIATVAVVDPAEFEAVTVYVASAEVAVGVPEIAPVVLLMVKPAGSAGTTA
jgi:hypothetical protein